MQQTHFHQGAMAQSTWTDAVITDNVMKHLSGFVNPAGNVFLQATCGHQHLGWLVVRVALHKA